MAGKRIYSLLILCSFLSIHWGYSQDNVDDRQELDSSILDDITNINQRIEQLSLGKSYGGLILKNKLDSLLDLQTVLANLRVAKRDERGLVIYPSIWKPFEDGVSFMDTVIFEPAFLPVAFEGKILPSDIDFRTRKDSRAPSNFHLIKREETLAPKLDGVKRVEQQRREYYTNNIGRVAMNALSFTGVPVIESDVVETKSPLKELLSTDKSVSISKPDLEMIEIKKLHWKRSGSHRFDLSQSAVSDYWQGNKKDNYNALNSEQVLRLNYKKGKVSFDNELKWDLKLMSTPADTVHSVNINKDEFRIYSVLGFESFIKHWSYSATFELKTPIFVTAPKNVYHKEDRQRSFLSPLYVNPSFGMRYQLKKQSKHDKYRKMDLKLDLSPLSINYTYVRDKYIKAQNFSGIKEGKKSRLELGHKFYGDFIYNFNRYSAYRTTLMCFTNHERVEAEMTNKFDYRLNRFFNVSLALNVRFDDAMKYDQKDKKWGYFQYNQELTFGLLFIW